MVDYFLAYVNGSGFNPQHLYTRTHTQTRDRGGEERSQYELDVEHSLREGRIIHIYTFIYNKTFLTCFGPAP